jgi:putative ABC transport system permease protein
VGRALRLDGVSHTVVGVMPADFDFPPPIVHEGNAMRRRAELWVPFAQDFAAGSRGSHNLMVLGRLDAGLDLERAEAEMRAVARRLAERYPDTNQDWSITLVPLDRQVTGEVRSQLWVLLGAVGFVLLIACVNVANLLLAQGTARRRELAVRSALGAGRGRLARQLFTESMLLALMGGALGLTLAFLGVRAIAALAPPNVPRLDEAGLDLTVVGFTLAVSVLTGLLFGMAPLLRQRKLALSEDLREGGRSGQEGREGGRLRSFLVAAEVAASLVLLVGAGLLFQSLLRLRTVDMGLDPANALTMRVTLPQGSYGEAGRRVDAFRSLQQRMEELPAVEAAGFIYDVPLDGDRQGTGFVFEGEADPTPDMYRLANFSIVTPGYFQALGIPLRQGRTFDGRDRSDGEAVILVNETLVRQYLSEEDPFGQRLVVHGSPRRVIGVVSDVRHNAVREESTPTMYLPYSQMSWSGTMSLVVRSEERGEAVLSTVRQAVREFDPALPVYGVKPMSQVLADSLGRERFATFIMALFSAVALLLAAIGIYGVISYTVSRRTRETGIRMALGAEQRDILRLVVGQGLRPVLLGATLGLVAALALGRTLAGLLYGIRATDPLTLAGVAAVLLAVALLAIVVPARRASRVDPAVALRVD